MKFSGLLPLGALASLVGYATAQPEAARFGFVSVSPQTIKPRETFTIHFNNTLGRFDPKYLDIYIQGTITATNHPLPYVLLERSDYPAGAENVYFNATLPDDEVLTINGTTWLVWAFITYPVNNSSKPGLEIGGTSYPVAIDLSDS